MTENHLLQEIVIPRPDVKNPPEHYLRLFLKTTSGQHISFTKCSQNELGDLMMDLACGLYLVGKKLPFARLTFDTLFGAFSLTTWLGICRVENVRFQASLLGRGIVRLCHLSSSGSTTVLNEMAFNANGEKIDISVAPLLPKEGIIYPEFEIHSDIFHLHNASYITTTPPRKNAHTLMVTTTFKRESFIQKNLDLIRANLSPSTKDFLQVLVVDNGNTLPTYDDGFMRIIHNPNFGGSGGFTRGVLEALASGDKYSHVLFCDDDVDIEPEAIARAARLACYLQDKDVLGGGMMSLSARDMLYEIGGTRNLVDVIPGKRGLAMSDPRSVAIYDTPLASDYFGWWFCMMPLMAFKQLGLPLPIFVRCDDEEFGRRMKKDGYRLVTLLGCVLHHEDFLNKDTPSTWFYVARNLMVMAMIHGSRDNILSTFSSLGLHALLLIATNKPLHAEGVLKGLQEALDGPEALVRTGSDTKHQQLGDFLKTIETPINSINPDVLASKLGVLMGRLFDDLSTLRERYLEQSQRFHTTDFWKQYLGLSAH